MNNTQEIRKAEEVLEAARKQVRDALSDALAMVKTETGMQLKAVDISVEMIWTGHNWKPDGNTDGDYLLGTVQIDFKV